MVAKEFEQGDTFETIKQKPIRITLDLDPQQHRFLKYFSIQNGIPSAMTMRCLLYMLETDINLAQRVVDEIFADDDEQDFGIA